MKVQIFNDLHADVVQPRPITVAPDVDAVVVAGDVCEGAERGFAWLRRTVPMQIPILMVLGNHELYRRCWSDELAQFVSPPSTRHRFMAGAASICLDVIFGKDTCAAG